MFSALMAVVHASDGTELCKFERQNGGLYVAKLKLREPPQVLAGENKRPENGRVFCKAIELF